VLLADRESSDARYLFTASNSGLFFTAVGHLRPHYAVTGFPEFHFQVVAEKRTFFSCESELSPKILTYENDLDMHVKSQDEPPRQISRSNIISLESYHPDTQTDTHRGPSALPGH